MSVQAVVYTDFRFPLLSSAHAVGRGEETTELVLGKVILRGFCLHAARGGIRKVLLCVSVEHVHGRNSGIAISSRPLSPEGHTVMRCMSWQDVCLVQLGLDTSPCCNLLRCSVLLLSIL